MLEHKKIQNLNDYFVTLNNRQNKGVYFYRINGYSDEIYGWNDCRQENQGNVDRLQRFSAAFCLV